MSRAEEMRELFARWKNSGQSLMAFGKTEDVSYQKLLYWRRKLGIEATRHSALVPETSPSTLVPLRIVPEPQSPQSVESNSVKFEVWLPNAVSLDVVPGFDEGELRRLVGVLLTC